MLKIVFLHKYNFLIQQSLERRDHLLGYVEAASGCRSLILQRYFGEKTDEVCGKCDLCVAAHKKSRGGDVRSEIREEILERLRHGGQRYGELVRMIDIGTEDQRESVLRSLLDKAKIKVDLQLMVTLVL